MPPIRDKSEAAKLIARTHPEWGEHQLRWRWLLDSWEGGERYRQAIYSYDQAGLPVRNLIRHKREYPDPREIPGVTNRTGSSAYVGGSATGMAGSPATLANQQDPARYASNDDYELRRARTPVPTFVAEATDNYVSKIYGSEIKREMPEGPPYQQLRDWMGDVDGKETPLDAYMKDTVAPLLVVLGCLDLCLDHPPAPEGETVETEADAARLGINGCRVAHILPDNLTWWRLDSAGLNYLECVVREFGDDGSQQLEGTGQSPGAGASVAHCNYRHWTATDWSLYNHEGELLDTQPHPFGRVPIVRVFDRRKPRSKNVGISRMEGTAERQREYYNRDSELILSDSTQAHPLLQGPEDYVQSDGTVPIGPEWLLPKKKNAHGGAATYEGFEVVDFPKGAAESIRQNKADIRNDVDRDTAMVKPAGTSGTNGTTVAQSGVSKSLDHDRLHDKLAALAKSLERAEHLILRLAAVVLTDGKPPEDTRTAIQVVYPQVFSLYAAEELGTIAGTYQQTLEGAGDTPKVDAAMLKEIVRKALPGRSDEEYVEFDSEVEGAVRKKATTRQQMREAFPLPGQPGKAPLALPPPAQGEDDVPLDDEEGEGPPNPMKKPKGRKPPG